MLKIRNTEKIQKMPEIMKIWKNYPLIGNTYFKHRAIYRLYFNVIIEYEN